MAKFYVVAAIVGTCHEFSDGGCGHGMIKSELQILCLTCRCCKRSEGGCHDFSGGAPVKGQLDLSCRCC